MISVGKLDHLDLNFEDLMPREILLVTTELGDLVEAPFFSEQACTTGMPVGRQPSMVPLQWITLVMA